MNKKHYISPHIEVVALHHVALLSGSPQYGGGGGGEADGRSIDDFDGWDM